eukprot:5924719-Pleurochrysis_carterae.AAC.2
MLHSDSFLPERGYFLMSSWFCRLDTPDPAYGAPLPLTPPVPHSPPRPGAAASHACLVCLFASCRVQLLRGRASSSLHLICCPSISPI